MKSNFFSLLLVAGLLALLSCQKVLDLPGPAYKRKAVMTGLIHPDSLLRVQLTFTAPPNTRTTYEVVENAEVTFYENEQLLGKATKGENGIYTLAKKPTSGKVYKVTAQIPDYGVLEAADRLPLGVNATLTASDPNPNNPNGNPDVQLNLQTVRSNQYYWLSVISLLSNLRLSSGCPPSPPGGFGINFPPSCQLEDFLETRRNYFFTDDTRLDRFNSYFETSRGSYLYLNLIRFDPALLKTSEVQLNFTFYNQTPKKKSPGERSYLDVIVAGEAMDRYLKTSLQSSMNRIRSADDALSNPFAEVTPVYSNVKNGLGIVGAANTVRLQF